MAGERGRDLVQLRSRRVEQLDERFGPPPEGLRIDDRGEAADGAVGAHAIDAPLDGGRGQGDAASDVVVAATGVFDEQRNNLTAYVIHRWILAHGRGKSRLIGRTPVHTVFGMTLLHPRKPATLLFDEAHSEAWTIRPELAARMQPAHPQDVSYAEAAKLLTQRDFTVRAHVEGSLADALAETDVLVLAHPADARWEVTTGIGSPRFSAA